MAPSYAVDVSGHQLIGEYDFVQMATGRPCEQENDLVAFRVCEIFELLAQIARRGGRDSQLVRIICKYYPDRISQS